MHIYQKQSDGRVHRALYELSTMPVFGAHDMHVINLSCSNFYKPRQQLIIPRQHYNSTTKN